MNPGTCSELFSVRKRKRSSVTAVLRGAPLSFQSGKSSASPRGSITAPERICAPTSDPFSTTQTEKSLPFSLHSCFKRIAVASPDGPAPTTTTSYSITSRSLIGRILLACLRPAIQERTRFVGHVHGGEADGTDAARGARFGGGAVEAHGELKRLVGLELLRQ